MSFKFTWSEKRLDEFVLFQRGFDLPKDNFIDGKVPVYGSTSILGYHNQVKVKAPCVITGRSGTLGKFQYATKDFWPHNTTLWIKDFKGNDPKFAYYILQCLDFSIFNSGGAVPTLNRNILKSFKLEIPPLETQKKIAKKLSNYDDLIENNQKQIELLEKKARLTYEEWFLRFRIDSEKLDIDEDTDLPFGWEKVKLGEVVSLKQGFALNKKSDHYISDKGMPLLKISDLLNETETLFVKKTIPKQFIINKNDIIFSRTGQVGCVFIGREGVMYNNCFKVIPLNKINSKYLYQLLNTKSFREKAQSLATGSAQPDLNHDAFKSIKVVIPNEDIQFRFEKMINIILLQIENLKKQNQKLKKARDILLPRLMSGMIEV